MTEIFYLTPKKTINLKKTNKQIFQGDLLFSFEDNELLVVLDKKILIYDDNKVLGELYNLYFLRSDMTIVNFSVFQSDLKEIQNK